MRSVAMGVGATALLLALLPNCSSDGGSADGVCGQYVDALIAYAQRCGTLGGDSTPLVNVRARYITVCQNAITSPGAQNLAGALQTCSNTVSTQSCDDDIKCDDNGNGTLADGAACAQDYQCVSGDCSADDGQCGMCRPRVAVGGACTSTDRCVENATCDFKNGASGTCQAQKIAKAGDACATNDVQCDSGLNCSFANPSTPVCTPRGDQGAKCAGSQDCKQTLACSKDGICSARAGLGQDCGDFFSGCGPGLACGADMKCAQLTFTATAGQPCDLVRQCARGRCKGLSLSGSGNGGTSVKPGTCEDPLADGAPCQVDNSGTGSDPPQCDEFAECVNGTCQLPNPAACSK